MADLTSVLPSILSLLFKSAEKGTLVEIVETAAKLVRLLEPLLDQLPVPGPAQPEDPARAWQGQAHAGGR